jgi:hypothetical protein
MRRFWIKGTDKQVAFALTISVLQLFVFIFLFGNSGIVIGTIGFFAIYFTLCHYFLYGCLFAKKYAKGLVGKRFSTTSERYNPKTDKFEKSEKDIIIHDFKHNQLIFESVGGWGKSAWNYKLLLYRLANDNFEEVKQ